MPLNSTDLDLKLRRTCVQHVKTLLWSLFGIAGVYLGIDGIVTGEVGFWQSLLFLIVGLLGIYATTTRIAINYEFSKDTLEISAWGNKRSVMWIDVVEVDIVPTFFGEPNMSVTTVTGKTEVITNLEC